MVPPPVESWTPTIGDPTFMGWFTVVAYVGVAVLCAIAARQSAARGHAWVWWGLAAMSLALAVNKQLDLQSWFTIVGKRMAIEQGWYEQRRTVQGWFITALVAIGAVGGGALWLALGRARRRFVWALVGATFLVVFIIVRAASFHHVDIFLKSDLWGIQPNWFLELGGLAILGYAAARDRKPTPSRRHRRPRLRDLLTNRPRDRSEMTWREIIVELWRRAGSDPKKKPPAKQPRRTQPGGANRPRPTAQPRSAPSGREPYRVIVAGPPRRNTPK